MNVIKKILNTLRSQKHLASYIVSRSPLILVSFWFDFLSHQQEIEQVLPDDKHVHLLFKLGWYKSREEAGEIKAAVEELNAKHPLYKFYFLANSQEEFQHFQESGLTTVFCNQNAFLDEKKFTPAHNKPRYKALYIARITPFKRYELAAQVDNLFVVGSWKEEEAEYAQHVLQQCKPANWMKRIPYFLVSRYMHQARCGLALSKIEGTMYVCTEYLLSGLPVVSTESKGGRHVYFDDRYVAVAGDSAESVAAKVDDITKRNIDGRLIREHTIAIMQEHRQRFIALINTIYASEGVERRFEEEWDTVFTHKLGLRMHVSRQIYAHRMVKKGMVL